MEFAIGSLNCCSMVTFNLAGLWRGVKTSSLNFTSYEPMVSSPFCCMSVGSCMPFLLGLSFFQTRLQSRLIKRKSLQIRTRGQTPKSVLFSLTLEMGWVGTVGLSVSKSRFTSYDSALLQC